MIEKEPNITFLIHRIEYHFSYIPIGIVSLEENPMQNDVIIY